MGVEPGHRPVQIASPDSSIPPALRWFAFAIFALLATASLFLQGPQIQVDEGSYLLSAATIAGKVVAHGVHGYYSGYSLLLVPAFAFGSDPDRIYHVALVINALMVATTPFALFRLTRLMYPEVDAARHVAVAVAATCYAPLLLISQHAMSESALVPLYAWMLATGAAAVVTRRIAPALYCGAIAGALLLVHPRGAAIAAPVIATLGAFCLIRPGLRRGLMALLIVAIAVAALHAPLEHAALKKLSMSGAYSPEKVFGRLGSSDTWFWIALNFLGSTTEVVVTSLGIFVIALRGIAMDLWRSFTGGWRSINSQTAILLAILLGVGIALLMSAVFFVPPERPDQIAYGRYALPAVVPMLAIGLMRLSLPRAQRVRDFAWAIVIALVCLGLMGYAFTRLPPPMTVPWNYINAPCLFLAQFFIRSHDAWWAIGVCFAVLGGALAFSSWRSGRVGVAMFAVLNLAIAALAWSQVALPQSKYYAHERHIDAVAKAFESTAGALLCIKMSPELDAWHAIDMRWRLFSKVAPLASKNDPPCVRGMIDTVASPDPMRNGMRLIALEHSPTNSDVIGGLFVEPGEALQRWEKANVLPALDSFGPLPPSEWHADIELQNASAIPKRVKPDTSFDVVVTVRNTSVNSRWTPLQDGAYPIRLGARVTPAGSDSAAGEFRTWIGAELKPGESTTEKIRVETSSEPGLYRAQIGVVQEKVAWFSGAREIEFEVESP